MPSVSLQRKAPKFQENPSDLDAQLLELGFLCEKDEKGSVSINPCALWINRIFPKRR